MGDTRISVGLHFSSFCPLLYLKHLVRGCFNSRNHTGRVEGALLNLGEIIRRVAIQDHLANWDQRVFRMWPDLGTKTAQRTQFKNSYRRQ